MAVAVAPAAGEPSTPPCGLLVGKPDTEMKRPSLQRMASTRADDGHTIITLTSTTYYCSESDKDTVVGVMRLGNLQCESRVSYDTHDETGLAKHVFVDTNGELVFAEGESFKEITIPLIDNDRWGTTIEFQIRLEEDSIKGADLNRYLSSATIRVMDDDAFPTNEFKEDIQEGRLDDINHTRLMIEYFKLTFGDAFIRKGTWKFFVLDQLHNFYFMLKLFVNIYLVDYVLKGEKEDLIIVKSKAGSLWVIFLLNTVPFMILFLLDQKRHGWKVGGTSRQMLQLNLLRKFMNYNDASRSGVDKGDMVMAMTRDIVKLVQHGYINMIKLNKELGKLVFILVFQLTAPVIFGRELSVIGVVLPTLGFPLFQLAFLRLRAKHTTVTFDKMNEEQNEFVDTVNATFDHYGIISDYGAKSHYAHLFAKVVQNFNGQATASEWILMNNLYWPKCLGLLLVNFYIVFAGTALVRAGPHATIGMFLAEILVFDQMGEAWSKIYKILLEMQTSFPALMKVTKLLNLPTDVAHRCKLSTYSRSESKLWREKAMLARDNKVLNLDDIPCRLQDVTVQRYGLKVHTFKGTIEVPAGSRCAIVGKKSQGKASLLKLLGGATLPTLGGEKGDPGYFVPSHARMLHVSLEPLFVRGTLMHNLTFGSINPDDIREERVLEICKLFDVEQEELDKHMGLANLEGVQFSHTTAYRYCLIRAFVSNPSMICIHKPTHVFDDPMSQLIMERLSDFVEYRGIAMGDGDVAKRLPRTCIFTSSEWFNIEYADLVVRVTEDDVVQIAKKDVTPDMLH